MGDMADFALDQVWTEEEARGDFRAGRMTTLEAYDRGIINEHGGEIGSEETAKPKTCRCCGRTGLYWGRHDDKWRLFTAEKTLHVCPVAPLPEFRTISPAPPTPPVLDFQI